MRRRPISNAFGMNAVSGPREPPSPGARPLLHGDWLSAFALPGSDVPFFRQADETARATLRLLVQDVRRGDLDGRPLA